MAVIRLAALQRLADCIQDSVPTLRGKICGGHASSPHRLGFPSLSIYGMRFKFFPDQAALHASVGATTAVFNVGRVEGLVQLRLGAQTSQRRYALEQEILEKVFWADIERPGIVVMAVPECHDATIAFELDENAWDDEKAFDKKWYSVTTVALQLPALVTKGSIHTIDELRLTLTEDLSTPIVSVPGEEKDTVSISEDGDLTQAASP